MQSRAAEVPVSAALAATSCAMPSQAAGCGLPVTGLRASLGSTGRSKHTPTRPPAAHAIDPLTSPIPRSSVSTTSPRTKPPSPSAISPPLERLRTLIDTDVPPGRRIVRHQEHAVARFGTEMPKALVVAFLRLRVEEGLAVHHPSQHQGGSVLHETGCHSVNETAAGRSNRPAKSSRCARAAPAPRPSSSLLGALRGGPARSAPQLPRNSHIRPHRCAGWPHRSSRSAYAADPACAARSTSRFRWRHDR